MGKSYDLSKERPFHLGWGDCCRTHHCSHSEDEGPGEWAHERNQVRTSVVSSGKPSITNQIVSVFSSEQVCTFERIDFQVLREHNNFLAVEISHEDSFTRFDQVADIQLHVVLCRKFSPCVCNSYEYSMEQRRIKAAVSNDSQRLSMTMRPTQCNAQCK